MEQGVEELAPRLPYPVWRMDELALSGGAEKWVDRWSSGSTTSIFEPEGRLAQNCDDVELWNAVVAVSNWMQ